MELHKPTYRVVKILELLEAAKKTGKSLSDISKILEIPKGTVSPVLKTLENLNYITFNPQTHRYTLGFRAFELGLDYGSDTDVIAMLQKNMQAIVRDINEICQLGVLSGPDVLYILKESPNNAVAIRSSIGAKLPAYATGLGKALLQLITCRIYLLLFNKFEKPNLLMKWKNPIPKFVALLCHY